MYWRQDREEQMSELLGKKYGKKRKLSKRKYVKDQMRNFTKHTHVYAIYYIYQWTSCKDAH